MNSQNNDMHATSEAQDELRPEYDAALLRNPVRGKHLAEYRAGTNLVLLAPDVAAVFPDAEAVNKVLRALIDAMPTHTSKPS